MCLAKVYVNVRLQLYMPHISLDNNILSHQGELLNHPSSQFLSFPPYTRMQTHRHAHTHAHKREYCNSPTAWGFGQCNNIYFPTTPSCHILDSFISSPLRQEVGGDALGRCVNQCGCEITRTSFYSCKDMSRTQ